ncbi:DUF4367 domain-containing protein [Gemmiger formicilis]
MIDKEKQNHTDFPEDSDEERLLFTRIAEAWALSEQTELEMEAMNTPDPELPDSFYDAMNAIVERLDAESAERGETLDPSGETQAVKEQLAKADAEGEPHSQDSEASSTERTPTKKKRFLLFKNGKMMAVAAMICIIVGIPAVAVASGVDFLEWFRNVDSSYTDIFFTDDDESQLKGAYRITDLPDGYEVLDVTSNPTMIQTVYGVMDDSTQPTISLQQYDEAPNIVSFDTEDLQETNVIVQGANAVCLTGDTVNILIWQTGDYYFQIISALDVETLVELANSVRH